MVCVVKRNIFRRNSYYPNDEVFDIDVKNVINKTKLSIKRYNLVYGQLKMSSSNKNQFSQNF